jgi:hypothetical protein
MDRITQKRRWGKDVWIFAICFCSIMFFCFGLYLGGLTMCNKTASIEWQLEETQKLLAESKNSVIIIDKEYAAQIGFHPGKKDLVCTPGGGEWKDL